MAVFEKYESMYLFSPNSTKIPPPTMAIKGDIPWLRSNLPRLGRRGAFAVPYGVWYEAVMSGEMGMELYPPGNGAISQLGKRKNIFKSAFFLVGYVFSPGV